MGRSSGYRPTKEQEADVLKLRAELATLRKSDWQKATRIMAQLTQRMGKKKGPMGGAIEPRACAFCGYYGHTKQFCVRRMEAEERAAADLLKQDKAEREAYDRDMARRREKERESGKVSQVALWEQLGVDWDWHPAGIGAFPRWYLEERARAVPKCTEPKPECGSCR